MMAYKRLSLTDITIPIGRGARPRQWSMPGTRRTLRASGQQPRGARSSQHARRRPVPTILTASRAWSQARRLGRRSVLHSSKRKPNVANVE